MKRIMKGSSLGRIKIILHGNIDYKMERKGTEKVNVWTNISEYILYKATTRSFGI